MATKQALFCSTRFIQPLRRSTVVCWGQKPITGARHRHLHKQDVIVSDSSECIKAKGPIVFTGGEFVNELWMMLLHCGTRLYIWLSWRDKMLLVTLRHFDWQHTNADRSPYTKWHTWPQSYAHRSLEFDTFKTKLQKEIVKKILNIWVDWITRPVRDKPKGLDD